MTTTTPAPTCSDEELATDGVRALARRPAPDRERGVELLAARLDRPMTVLGILFLLVVLGQNVATSTGVQRGFVAVGWGLWAVFVAEFALRLWLAPSRSRFLRRSWWQLLFLVLPMLRFLRVVALLRVARAGRVLRVARAGGVLSSAVRSSRSAGRLLSSRIGWVAALTGIVVLATSQLLYTLDLYDDYGQALHAAVLATVAGEPLGLDDGFAQVIEVGLLIYATAVFAALAGTLGAFFIEQRAERERESKAAPVGRSPLSPPT